MPYRFDEPRAAGRTDLHLPLLGMGTVQIGGWPRRVEPEAAEAALQGAWDHGIRYFDVAPMYGFGMSEERLGAFLKGRDRDSYVISTKVGRLIEPAGDADESFWQGAPARTARFDFSHDGILRSVEASQRRLGIDRFDILFIHDPDSHMDQAVGEAAKALVRLKDEGVVRAIGAGMNQNPALARFTADCPMDIHLLAGRYTILDHDALTELFPVCADKGTTMVIGGVFNSGVLNNPVEGSTFDYKPLDAGWRDAAMQGVRVPKDFETGAYWLGRAQAIAAVCARHAVPLEAAALQFAAASPFVSSIVVGAGRAERMAQNIGHLALDIPADLWAELRDEGLIAAGAPVPGTAGTVGVGRH